MNCRQRAGSVAAPAKRRAFRGRQRSTPANCLLATGSIWQGVVLIAYGALVIGLVDNVLRPILVGQDTKMPNMSC